MFRNLLTTTLLLLNVYAMPLFGQWNNDPAVNNIVSNNQESEYTLYPITDGSGGSIAFFHIGSKIYAQKITTQGLVAWGTTAKPVSVCNILGNSNNIIAIPDGTGGAFVAWTDERYAEQNGYYSDIYIQHISAAGKSLWDSNGIKVTNTVNQYNSNPALCSDGNGGFIISWSFDDRVTNRQVKAQRYNVAGQSQWADNGITICTAPGFRSSCIIVSDRLNGAIIFFLDTRNNVSGSNYNYIKNHDNVTNEDIYAQRIDGNGSLLWTGNGVPVCTAPYNQSIASYASNAISDDNGGAILVFMDTRYDPSELTRSDVFVQKINSDGSAAWPINGITIRPLQAYYEMGAIVSDNAGGIVIAFEDGTETSGSVYCQRFTSSGTTPWTANGITVSSPGMLSYSPKIGSDGMGNFIFTYWTEDSQAMMKAQKISPEGARQWSAGGVIISNDVNSETSPTVITSDSGSVVLTWADSRYLATGRDVFASKLLPNGTLAGTSIPVYTTANNGDWDNPATWLGGVVPPNDVIVVILNEIVVNVDVSCYSLYLRPPGTVKVNPGISLTIKH